MIKYYCNKCGKEITGTIYIAEIRNSCDTIAAEHWHLCRGCKNRLRKSLAGDEKEKDISDVGDPYDEW